MSGEAKLVPPTWNQPDRPWYRTDIKRGSSSSGRVARVPSPAISADVAPSEVRSSASAATNTPAPSSSTVAAAPRRLHFRLILGLVLSALLTGAFALYERLNRTAVVNPQNMQIAKLTENGGAISGAISPDGRYAAYIKRGEQQSLWVKQIATGSEAQVVPAGAGSFGSRQPAFTPDGNYIYYEHNDPSSGDGELALYSIPSLGGAPQRILDDIDTAVAFSPDGKQIVFGHFDAGHGSQPQLVIANSDGSNRHVITEREALAVGNSAISWSPDGKYIAAAQYQLTKDRLSAVLVFTPQGELVKTFPYEFLVDGVAWLPDSVGMFLQVRTGQMNLRPQIKFQPHPSGAVQNLTNDLNEYHGISVTGDGKALVTVQELGSSAVYVGSVPAKLPGEIKLNPIPITHGQADGGFLEWGIDGKLYLADQTLHSFRMNPDGTARTEIPDRDTTALYPISCGPDAVVFALFRDNQLNLFREVLGSGKTKQLTSERDAENPICTKDGKWVYYVDFFGPELRRVSTETGKSETVAKAAQSGATLSPDDKRIALIQTAEHKNVVLVQDLDGGNKLTLPGIGLTHSPRWAPDGRALILAKSTGAGSNLFYQPLDGSTPTQITHLEGEPLAISEFSFSPDGKQIAITRARVNDSDLVMFSNFR